MFSIFAIDNLISSVELDIDVCDLSDEYDGRWWTIFLLVNCYEFYAEYE